MSISLEDFKLKLEKVKASGTEWVARCPAHDDKRPSMSFREIDDKLLVHCHAGCSVHEIADALDLRVSDLFSDATKNGAKRTIVATYKYADEAGTVLYEVVRYSPKDFLYRRPDSNAGYVWNIQNVRRVLYNLPAVKQAIADGTTVWITEGEKDADALIARGHVATTNPMGAAKKGASKWKPEYTDQIAGAKEVRIVGDNDDVGINHARGVAEQIKGVVGSVVVLRSPHAHDVADHFGAGRDVDGFVPLEAPEIEQRVVHSPADPMPNAEQYISETYAHDERDLLVHHGGNFEVWNGTCWPELEDAALRSGLYDYFGDAVYWAKGDGGPTLERFKPNRHKVHDLVDALKAIAHVSRDLTAPVWLIDEAPVPAGELVAVQNGLLHVPTRRLIDHTPNYYTNWALPFAFDTMAPVPLRWLRFLDELFGDDDESKLTLGEWFGYFLAGDTRLQKLLMLVGPRRSGKGTIARVLRGLLGNHNVAGPTLASLSDQFGLASLVGKAAAIIADARIRTENDVIVERLLSISGEDTLSVQRKYRDDWVGKLGVRFMLISNEIPKLQDSSGALPGRFIVLHMTRSFYGNENENLTDELLEELPGILNWSLEGLDRLRERRRFIQPTAALEVLHEMEDLGSPIAAFLRDECVLGPYEVQVEALFGRWRIWCQEQSIYNVGSVQTFGRDLRAAVPGLTIRRSRDRDQSRFRFYRGLSLKPLHEEVF